MINEIKIKQMNEGQFVVSCKPCGRSIERLIAVSSHPIRGYRFIFVRGLDEGDKRRDEVVIGVVRRDEELNGNIYRAALKYAQEELEILKERYPEIRWKIVDESGYKQIQNKVGAILKVAEISDSIGSAVDGNGYRRI